jgi:hypothetical protein
VNQDIAHDRNDIERAIKHGRAGLRALEEALGYLDTNLRVYPTHLFVAGVELAAATEIALAAGLRNQEPGTSLSQNR